MKIIRNVEPEIEDFENPELVFEKMADFVTNIDPRYLNEAQRTKLLNIIEKIEEDEELDEEIKAQRSTSMKKQYASKYYTANKNRLKNQKQSLKTSVEGNTRKVMGPIYAKSDRTPTGKKKLSYNT